jgi:uncharacterized protein YkwD
MSEYSRQVTQRLSCVVDNSCITASLARPRSPVARSSTTVGAREDYDSVSPPTLRRRVSLSVTLLLLAVTGLGLVASPVSARSTEEVLEEQFLAQLNAERAARGAPAMQAEAVLGQASDVWSASMASRRSLNHSSDGRAEIIGRGWWTGQVTNAWMRSPSHRNLVVDPNLRYVGVGVVCDDGGQMWVTVQFRRLDVSKPTLGSSATSPIATAGDTGSDCGDQEEIQQIRRLYYAYFERESDTGGLAYWAGELADGSGLASISDAFALSGEFVSLYGSVDNRQFVELVYQNVLRRDPDGNGMAYWVLQMNDGMSRGEVMVGFSESSEFRVHTGIS